MPSRPWRILTLIAVLAVGVRCAVKPRVRTLYTTWSGAGHDWEVGNDLSTPRPEFDFAGLKPGDRWCLCAARWAEALEAGRAPGVVLRATEVSALEYCALEDLREHGIDGA